MIDNPNYNEERFKREMSYPSEDYEEDLRDMSIEDMILRDMWRCCVEGR